MRSHSGHDESSNNNHDKTLKDNEGKGGTGSRPGVSDGAPFEVAADHEQPGGKRSPSARGRGETGATDPAAATDAT